MKRKCLVSVWGFVFVDWTLKARKGHRVAGLFYGELATIVVAVVPAAAPRRPPRWHVAPSRHMQLTAEGLNRRASNATIHARFRIGGPLDRRTGLAATRAAAWNKQTLELGCCRRRVAGAENIHVRRTCDGPEVAVTRIQNLRSQWILIRPVAEYALYVAAVAPKRPSVVVVVTRPCHG